MLGKDITELVVTKMEEHTPFGPKSATLLAGGDHLDEVKPVYSYIRQSLAEAANEMLAIIPVNHLVYKTANVTGKANGEDQHIGTIQMPNDFLRLHTLRMDGWTRPVHYAIPAEHPAYTLQFSRWTRGTKQKPVVTIDGVNTKAVYNPPLRELSLLVYNVYSDVDWILAKKYAWVLISDETTQLYIHGDFKLNSQTIATKTISKTLQKGEPVVFNAAEELAAAYEGSSSDYDEISNVRIVAEFAWTDPSQRRSNIYIYDADGQYTHDEYVKELHYYSCDESATHEVKDFKYIPCFDGDTDYEYRVAELIALQCARKVYEIYGQTEQANMLTNEINSVMENLRQ